MFSPGPGRSEAEEGVAGRLPVVVATLMASMKGRMRGVRRPEATQLKLTRAEDRESSTLQDKVVHASGKRGLYSAILFCANALLPGAPEEL